jgi:hypothetical protein
VTSTRAATEARFAWTLTAVYIAVLTVGMYHHELWRDEWQAWMLARDSDSIAEMFHSMRYEGHPAAWYLLLYPFSRLTRSPIAMQTLHALIAAAVVWVVARWSPLSRVQRVLFAFGYFTLYEYGVVSRGYALGALCLFGFCALWPVRRRSYVPLAIALALLAQTSAFGIILLFALGVGIVAEWAIDAELRRSLRNRWLGTAAAAALVIVSVAVSVAQIRPPPDARFTGRPLRGEEAVDVTAAREATLLPARVFIPIPGAENGVPEWGSSAVVDQGMIENVPLYAAAILLALAVAVLRRPVAFVVLVAGTGLLLYFWYAIHVGSLRHHGHLLLLIVAAWWLALDDGPAWKRLPTLADPTLFRVGSVLISMILAVQVAGGIVIYIADLRLPFTMAGHAAATLRAEGADSMLVVGTPTRGATAVAGYLDQPILFLEDLREGTFAVWGEVGRDTPRDSVLARAGRLLTSGTPELLLVSRWSLRSTRHGSVEAVLRGAFTNPLVRDETYHVYRVRHAVP